ncbi:MAG TPA: alcohol dehydrogenase catalytic domain-containing protein, partial [Chthonomonadales bacterium]|nr:alcohol dehydrogenase catalytic domain-containing protein [Chthonomonadales bacterium]
MRAAVYHGVKNVTVEDIARPVAGPEDVILRVRACGICGSDVHTYNAGWYGSPGQVMGHEFSGEVVEIGSDVSGLA